MTFKNLHEKELHKSIILLQPTMPFLVTTLNDDLSINIAPFAWGTPISQYPPMMSLALLNKPAKQDSLINIERSGEFVVNLVELKLAHRLIEASYEYKEDINKFQELNFQPQTSKKIMTPGITEARARLECKVTSLKETGDHMLIISRIVAASYNPYFYSGDLLLDLDKADPVIHLEQFLLENGQAHIFIRAGGYKVLNIPFKEKLNIDEMI